MEQKKIHSKGYDFEKDIVRVFSYKEFMNEFRPDGFGEMIFYSGNNFDSMKEESREKVTDINCDICNNIINDKQKIYMIRSKAICQNCFTKYYEFEK